MKKTELLDNVLSILKAHKIKNEDLVNELTLLIGPKAPGARAAEFPPKLDDEGNIIEKYCLTLKEYRPIEEFNKSSKSKDGYHYETKFGEACAKYHSKLAKREEDNINALMAKVLEGEVSRDEAKVQIDELKAKIEGYKADRASKVIVSEEDLIAEGFKVF